MGRRRVPSHPWYFEAEYRGDRRVRWDEEGGWSGDEAMVAAIDSRIATGEWVTNAVPSSFPPEHWLSVVAVLIELFGPWERIVAQRMPDPPWFNDPPGRIY